MTLQRINNEVPTYATEHRGRLANNACSEFEGEVSRCRHAMKTYLRDERGNSRALLEALDKYLDAFVYPLCERAIAAVQPLAPDLGHPTTRIALVESVLHPLSAILEKVVDRHTPYIDGMDKTRGPAGDIDSELFESTDSKESRFCRIVAGLGAAEAEVARLRLDELNSKLEATKAVTAAKEFSHAFASLAKAHGRRSLIALGVTGVAVAIIAWVELRDPPDTFRLNQLIVRGVALLGLASLVNFTPFSGQVADARNFDGCWV